jgi:hypothetical protein
MRDEMKCLVLTGFFLLVFGSHLQAQEPSDIHQHTVAPSNARFEIVQSELAAKWTFRLDRVTGHVAQLVHTKDDEPAWEEMRVIGIPYIPSPTRPRFQIFTSGVAARHTFMIDTDEVKTWVIVTNKGKNEDGTEYETSLWQPFAE